MSTNIKDKAAQRENPDMQRVKVRRAAEITLPEQARAKLGVSEGDYLDVEVVENGVLLKPVTEREKGWDQVFAAMGRVRPTPEQARKSLEEQEQEIYEIVEEFRHHHG